MTRKLSPDPAANSDIPKLDLDEKKFRWLLNDDAMATEKTAEGIRLFHEPISHQFLSPFAPDDKVPP